jgi:hypothetical protein
VAQRCGLRALASAAELLDLPTVDLAIIEGWDTDNPSCVRDALARNKAILLEKPGAPNLAITPCGNPSPCSATYWWSSRPSRWPTWLSSCRRSCWFRSLRHSSTDAPDELVRELGDQIVEGAADHRYAGTTQQVHRVRISYYRLYFLTKLLNNLMNHLAPLSVLMVGGYLVINDGTTVGTIVAFISGFGRMADPSRQLLAYYRLAAETQGSTA